MSKVAGFIIGGAELIAGIALVATGVGGPLGVQLIIAGSTTILTQAIVDLTAPKTPARQASETTLAIGEQPRCMQIGETYTPGSLVDAFDFGGKYGTDWECLIIRLADHKCDSLTGFYVNSDYVAYTGNGNYAQYRGVHYDHLHLYFRGDTSTDTFPSEVTDNWPDWSSGDIGQSGCDVAVLYRCDTPNSKNPIWPAGRPHFGFVIKGKLCYDPRKDDTVPGGSGSHRWDDASTWEWTENAIVNWYNFERGVYANDDTSNQSGLLVGRGLSAEESPPEYIFAAANLCDEVQAAVFPYQQVATLGPDHTDGWSVSPDGRWIIRRENAELEWWNVLTRTLMGYSSASPDPVDGGISNIVFDDADNAIYYGTTLAGDTYRFVTAPLSDTVNEFITNSSSEWSPGPTRWLAGESWSGHGDAEGAGGSGYFRGLSFVSDAAGGCDFCLANGDVWGLFLPFSSNHLELRNLTGTATTLTVTGAVTRTHPGPAYFCHVASESHFFVVADGHWYLIDDSSGTIKDSGSQSYDKSNWLAGLMQVSGNNVSFWSDFTEVSLRTGAVVRTLDPTDWLSEGTGGDIFDPTNYAIVSKPFPSGGNVTWRFLDRHGGYRIAGPIYSNQEFIDVEQMFASALGGNIITYEGTVQIEPGQAKSVVATITDDDLLLGSEVSWNQGFLGQSDAEWINTIVATYVEPDQKWNSHNAPPLRVDADIVADGKPREAQLTLRLVRYQPQAQRVAEINRRLGRLWGRASIKLGPRFCELEAGDWISWQSDRYFGGSSVTFRIDASTIDEKWQNALTLRQIDGSVYADDAEFPLDGSAPYTTPPPPSIGAPDAGNWTLTAVTLDSAGASIPALEIAGSTADDDQVEEIILEYWIDDGVGDPSTSPDSVAWTVYGGSFPPDTTKVDISPVMGGATYYAAITYVVSGVTGDRLVLGPVTVADYNANPILTEEDGVTHLVLEDDAVSFNLG